MTADRHFYLLALSRVEGIGDVNAKKLINHCGSAEAVFRESKANLQKIHGIGNAIIKELKNRKVFSRIEKELDFIHNNGIKVVTYNDSDYPKYLKQCYDAPLLLFLKGQIDFTNPKIISVVGTRQMTAYGKAFIRTLFDTLKKYNPIVVSGLAYGVDIFTHQQALEHNLQTIAVLAHGLDRIYPKTHKKEANSMLRNGGLLTDFWSGTNPDRENFVKRNRIVAGISQATLVIESAEKGGSLITADIANSYNRDVFALPGRITDAYSKGCNNLIKTNRAATLTSAKDLEYLLNWEYRDKEAKPMQKQLFIDITIQEQKIYEYLIKEGKQQLDTIALHCNYPIRKTVTILLNLELKSLVRPIPGKFFEAI